MRTAASSRRSPADGSSPARSKDSPGSLINFGTNLFYNGDINNIKKDNPEIALDVNGSIDPNKYWFNVDGFVRDPALTPTASTRARSRSRSTA